MRGARDGLGGQKPAPLLGPAGRDAGHTPSLLEIPLNFEG